MQPIIQGKRTVGEFSDDGSVYAVAGRNRQQVGAVAPDGTVLIGDQPVGSVDAAGNVFDADGTAVGSVNKGGKVFYAGRSIGHVPGDDPRRAGAALLLLFDPPAPIPQSSYVPQRPSESPNWIVVAVCAGIALMALMFVVAFVVATSIVWAVMLLLGSIGALCLAGDIARSLPEDKVAALQMVTWTTKRGEATKIAPSALSPFVSPFPLLFLALTPALAYGIIIGCVSLGASAPDSATGNLLLFCAAIIAGTVVSYLAARKIMRTRLNTLLMARLNGTQTAPVGEVRDWNRFAGYAGMGLAALLVFGGGIASWYSSRNAPLHTASSNSVASNSASMPSTTSSTASQPPRESGGDAEPDGDDVKTNSSNSVTPMQGERFSQTRAVYLHDSDINGWSYSGVRYALNEMYARHGLQFKSAPILHQFQKFPWYQPIPSRSEADIEAQFTPIERANQLLLAQRRDALQRAGQAIK